MRLRITALPFFLVTVKPARGLSPILAIADSSSVLSRTSRRNSGPRRFSPFLTVKNSALLRRRSICLCDFISSSPRCCAGQSSGKPLATACTASGKNLAAAGGCHARTETVTTLADELGWLISALHLFNTAVCGPSWFCLLNRSWFFLTSGQHKTIRKAVRRT